MRPPHCQGFAGRGQVCLTFLDVGGIPRGHPMRSAARRRGSGPQTRIHGVPDGIPEQVQPQDRQGDGASGEDGDPGHLADGRFRCRSWQRAYTFRSVWAASRLSERVKRRPLEHFVLAVLAYRLRFRGPASRPVTERLFWQIRGVLSLAEDCQAAFTGEIECDEMICGGRRPGKPGCRAARKIMVLGLLQRKGRVRVFLVAKRKTRILYRLVRQRTTPGARTTPTSGRPTPRWPSAGPA